MKKCYIYVINKDEFGNDIPATLISISEKPIFKIPKIYKKNQDGTTEIIKCGFVYECNKSIQELQKLYWKDKSIDFYCYDWSNPENPVLRQDVVDKKIKELKYRHAEIKYKEDLIQNFDVQKPLHLKFLFGQLDKITEQEKTSIINNFESSHKPEQNYWLNNNLETKK